MLLIPCPWCGERTETEYHYGGQAHVPYPADPDALDDAAWGEYLFVRDNPRGRFAERWCHSMGCRRWFNAVRDTVSNELVTTYAMGERPPDEAERGGMGELMPGEAERSGTGERLPDEAERSGAAGHPPESA